MNDSSTKAPADLRERLKSAAVVCKGCMGKPVAHGRLMAEVEACAAQKPRCSES